jgi:hypothetical protein
MTVSPTQRDINFQGIMDILQELPANAKKNVRIVFVLPSGDKKTKSFGCKNITHIPQGTPDEMIKLVESFPQCVYRLPLQSVNEIG